MGNLDTVREWGDTQDYCEAMWLALQQDQPDDFVIGTGDGRTIREWILDVYRAAGVNLHFEGEGLNEIGVDDSGNVLIKINPKYFRPNDAKVLVSNSNKFRKKTGWNPKFDSDSFIKNIISEE